MKNQRLILILKISIH